MFVGADGKRKAIRLGKMPSRTAEAVKLRVEHLVVAQTTGFAIDGETARWVAGLPADLRDKLAAKGLIAPTVPKTATQLGAFVTAYIAGRNDIKQATKVAIGQVAIDMMAYFGGDRDVASITSGDADDFKQHLIGRSLASSTIGKRLRNAKTLFKAMARRKLIDANPFDGVTMTATGIADRQRFIPREDVARLLAACPDHHWRTIIVLARYGGLRCPSEVLSLRWQDINVETNRVIVTSPKTERAGKPTRVIPLFPELAPCLTESQERAPVGSIYVLPDRLRKAAIGPRGWQSVNLRTTFEKIVARAGLEPWPKPFQNMRASRETELAQAHSIKAVTEWLGNTEGVAMRHYLMVTDQQFKQATDLTAEAAQNPAQYTYVPRGTIEEPPGATPQITPRKPVLTGLYSTVRTYSIAREGLEPPTKGL